MHFAKLEEWAILDRSGIHRLIPQDVLTQIRERYRETTRSYHTWDHALSVVSWVTHALEVMGPGPNDAALMLAALYHDVVYDAEGSPSNESRSVAVMQDTLRDAAHLSDAVKEQATGLIMATAQHGKLESSDVDRPAAILLDCDIASFGETRWEVVLWNEHNIVAEYLQRYTVEQVAAGRTAFLQKMLTKQSIFLTPYFVKLFEGQARLNIQRLLKEVVCRMTQTVLPP